MKLAGQAALVAAGLYAGLCLAEFTRQWAMVVLHVWRRGHS